MNTQEGEGKGLVKGEPSLFDDIREELSQLCSCLKAILGKMDRLRRRSWAWVLRWSDVRNYVQGPVSAHPFLGTALITTGQGREGRALTWGGACLDGGLN